MRPAVQKSEKKPWLLQVEGMPFSQKGIASPAQNIWQG
jgi:hypothetical protein